MSGASFTFRVTGSDEIERQMAAIAAGGEDLTEFNQAFGLILESNTIDRFDRETAPDGSAWEPSIRAKVEGGKTLTDTARLKGSLTSEGDAREIRVGSNVRYAAPHQLGATIRAKAAARLFFKLPGGLGLRTAEEVVLPARPFLGIGPEDRDDGAELFRDFFAERAPDLFAGGSA